MGTARVDIDGHRVTLSSLDKVMYPSTDTTKADVLRYYGAVAPLLIDQAQGRPATLRRWPTGVGTADRPVAGFFQKGLAGRIPAWLRTTVVPHGDHENAYPLVNDLATLTWLVQLNTLEFHTPQWRVDENGAPQPADRIVIDLDPGDGMDLRACARVAMLVRRQLSRLGWSDVVPVTSGSKGIHLYAGLDGPVDDASALVHEVALRLEREHPRLVVSDMAKHKRVGRVLIDWSQNSRSKTTITPYSLRGRERPTAAVPRTWEEIVDPALRHLTLDEVIDRVTAPAPARRASPPSRPPISPMLASPTGRDGVPAGWCMEMKWDGMRVIAEIRGGVVALWSRSGRRVTSTFADVVGDLLDASAGHDMVIDGEMVALDAEGRPSFSILQTRIGRNRPGASSVRLAYLAFDLLSIDGTALIDRPYRERRHRLESEVAANDHVQVPPVHEIPVDVALKISRDLGLEGVVAKRPDARYQPGRRSPDWRKVTHENIGEAVVVGWMPGADRTLGSIVLALPDESGSLRYAGRVGTGFSAGERAALLERLQALRTPTAVLDDAPRSVRDGTQWVEPVLVSDIRYSERTAAGRFRHPSWRGLRPDKSVADVTGE